MRARWIVLKPGVFGVGDDVGVEVVQGFKVLRHETDKDHEDVVDAFF